MEIFEIPVICTTGYQAHFHLIIIMFLGLIT